LATKLHIDSYTINTVEENMSRKNVLDFLDKGADDRNFRIKYDNCFSTEKFVEMADEDGFSFSVEDLQKVLKENGDSFESFGNPPKKSIWV
jgi:predicted ribosomally synthesized peptide with nif11-like leader